MWCSATTLVAVAQAASRSNHLNLRLHHQMSCRIQTATAGSPIALGSSTIASDGAAFREYTRSNLGGEAGFLAGTEKVPMKISTKQQAAAEETYR